MAGIGRRGRDPHFTWLLTDHRSDRGSRGPSPAGGLGSRGLLPELLSGWIREPMAIFACRRTSDKGRGTSGSFREASWLAAGLAHRPAGPGRLGMDRHIRKPRPSGGRSRGPRRGPLAALAALLMEEAAPFHTPSPEDVPNLLLAERQATHWSCQLGNNEAESG